MKIEKIFSKYGIEKNEYTKDLRTFCKLESSEEVTIIKNKYFLNNNIINDELTSEVMLTVDDNDLYENIASLNIEGISSTKASSSKARDVVKDISTRVEDEYELSKLVLDVLDTHYQTLSEKKRPSKVEFMNNIGMNLATHRIEEGNIDQLTLEDISNLYSLLTISGNTLDKNEKLEQGKSFRQGEVNITDGLKIIDNGIPASKVESKMKLLIELMNSETSYENRTLASIVHFLFVEIHPYYDGNGRMSRLITKYMSKGETSGGVWAKHMNKIIDWTRSQYYKSIKMSRTTSDLTYFIIYMDWVYNISFSAEQIIFDENQRLIEYGKKMSELKSQVIIYLLTFSNLFISWKDIQKNVVPAKDISEQGIKKALNEMAEDDILIKQKADNNNVYKISARISKEYNLIK